MALIPTDAWQTLQEREEEVGMKFHWLVPKSRKIMATKWKLHDGNPRKDSKTLMVFMQHRMSNLQNGIDITKQAVNQGDKWNSIWGVKVRGMPYKRAKKTVHRTQPEKHDMNNSSIMRRLWTYIGNRRTEQDKRLMFWMMVLVSHRRRGIERWWTVLWTGHNRKLPNATKDGKCSRFWVCRF